METPDRHANTIRLFVLLPEQSPGSYSKRTAYQKAGGDSGNVDDDCERVKGPAGSLKSVEAILEESTENSKACHCNSSRREIMGTAARVLRQVTLKTLNHLSMRDSSASVDNRELEQHMQTSDPENFQSEERSDSDVNNDRSTSSWTVIFSSSSHSSDTLCNADNAQIPLANGLDSHSITSSRRTKANEGKKETWDTAEEDS